MAKDGIQSLQELISSLASLKEETRKEFEQNLNRVLRIISIFEDSAKGLIMRISGQEEGLTELQQENMKLVQNKVEIQVQFLKGLLEDMRSVLSVSLSETRNKTASACCQIMSTLEILNKRAHNSCQCPINPILIRNSLPYGCEAKRGYLRLKKCATCGKPIKSQGVEKWLAMIPKRSMSRLGIPSSVIQTLDRSKIPDICEICKEPIEGYNDPITLKCDCMVCCKCVKTYNTMIANKIISTKRKEKLNKVKFRCPKCSGSIKKDRLFTLFGSAEKFLNLFRLFTLLSLDVKELEFSCVGCTDCVSYKDLRQGPCKHTILCSKCCRYNIGH